jgi:hypothetical protein
MSQVETAVLPTSQVETAAIPPADPARASVQSFLAKDSETSLCIQAFPDPSTPVGRNTLGLWVMAIPLVVILLFKALFGRPAGFMGWMQIVIIVLGFSFIGGGLMEWGLSGEASMNDWAKAFLVMGGFLLVGLMLLRLGLVVGGARRKGGSGGGSPRMIMVQAPAQEE